MINVCPGCGKYRADKDIDKNGPFAVCPECGNKTRFSLLPLFIVSGASGTGKTSVCDSLLGKTDMVVLDSDILWQEEFNKPETNYRRYFETWLRLSKNISQSGRPVVLFGAGLGVPQNIEPCVERRYFSKVHYLGLYCSAKALEERLKKRPQWRGSGRSEYIEEQIKFNKWFMEYGNEKEPKIDLIDTTGSSVEETAREVMAWLDKRRMSYKTL
jgi:broad-specificity NMP kinase